MGDQILMVDGVKVDGMPVDEVRDQITEAFSSIKVSYYRLVLVYHCRPICGSVEAEYGEKGTWRGRENCFESRERSGGKERGGGNRALGFEERGRGRA